MRVAARDLGAGLGKVSSWLLPSSPLSSAMVVLWVCAAALLLQCGFSLMVSSGGEDHDSCCVHGGSGFQLSAPLILWACRPLSLAVALCGGFPGFEEVEKF